MSGTFSDAADFFLFLNFLIIIIMILKNTRVDLFSGSSFYVLYIAS